ncbi:hypothetical protein C8J56DRAFT_853639 [Mycena floridula]|nr:hypothetical protein C8J56DRAFT_853639 [Mycena floridula]
MSLRRRLPAQKLLFSSLFHPRSCPRRNLSAIVQEASSSELDLPPPDGLRTKPYTFQPDTSHTKRRQNTILATYNMRIENSLRGHKISECFEIAAEMKREGVFPDADTYTTLILAAAVDNRNHDAWAILEDMLSMGVQPTQATLHAMLSAHAQRPSLYLWNVIDRMVALGLHMDATTYTFLINLYSKEGNMELALRYWQVMRDKNLTTDLVTVSNVIESFATAGFPRLAIDIAQSVETESVRRLEPGVWMACMSAAATSLWGEGVIKCWDFLVGELGLTPDEGLCLSVLHTAGRCGIPHLASEVLACLKRAGIPWQEHHFAPLFMAFCQTREIKDAIGVLDVMQDSGVTPLQSTVKPLIPLIDSDIDTFDKIWSILDEIKAEGHVIDVTVFNIIIEAAVRLRDMQRAVGAYKAMSDYDVEPTIDTFHAVLKGAVATSHVAFATGILDEMKAINIKPTRETYELMIMVSLTQASYDNAFFYLEDLKAAQFIPSFEIYRRIIHKCCTSGDPRWNNAIQDMMECGHDVPEALMNDAEKLFHQGEKARKRQEAAAAAPPRRLSGAAQDYIDSGGLDSTAEEEEEVWEPHEDRWDDRVQN